MTSTSPRSPGGPGPYQVITEEEVDGTAQRLLIALAVFAGAVTLWNQEIAAGLVAAGALIAWKVARGGAGHRPWRDAGDELRQPD
jgi:hypothetical protein